MAQTTYQTSAHLGIQKEVEQPVGLVDVAVGPHEPGVIAVPEVGQVAGVVAELVLVGLDQLHRPVGAHHLLQVVGQEGREAVPLSSRSAAGRHPK